MPQQYFSPPSHTVPEPLACCWRWLSPLLRSSAAELFNTASFCVYLQGSGNIDKRFHVDTRLCASAFCLGIRPCRQVIAANILPTRNMSDDELKSPSPYWIHSPPAPMLATGSLGIAPSSSMGVTRRHRRGPVLSIDTQIADDLNLHSTSDANSPLLLICVDGKEVARTEMKMGNGDTDCWHARCSL